jgi:hypothetical protein
MSSTRGLTVRTVKDTRLRPSLEGHLAASIEILYLRFPVHPNITVIQIGPGIARIDKEGDSFFVIGTEDGPLAGKKVEIPGDNVAAVQWTLEGDEPAPAATS